MKRNRRKAVVVVIILLLISVGVTGFNSPSLAEARNVDILKIFVCGILTGVLISLISEIYFDKKKSVE